MKSLGLFAALFATTIASTGCEQQKSKLDEAPKAGAENPAVAQLGTGSLDDRVARLEQEYSKYAEVLGVVKQAYDQQKGAGGGKGRQRPGAPDPNAVFAVDITSNLQNNQSEGPNDALVTIVEGFDFACPHCQRVSPILDELVKEYDGKVRVVFKNMVVHPPVNDVHLASCAAAKQNKYNEFRRDAWEKSYAKRDYGEDNMMKIAADLGLDANKFKADMHGDDCKQFVETDGAELRKFHVNGTPVFFINGKHIGGGIPKEAFKKVIDEKLQIAQASGVPGSEYYAKEIMGKGEKEFKAPPGE